MSDSQQSKRAQKAKRNPPVESTQPRKVPRPSPSRIPLIPVALQPAPVVKVYTTIKGAVEAVLKRVR